jgi:integrase/recombinase XerC
VKAEETYLQSFIEYLQFEKRFSIHTTRAYHQDLREFYFFIQQAFEIHSFAAVNLTVLRAYMVYLSEKGNQPKTIHRKISSLQSFSKYLLKMQLISTDPLQKIKKPKVSKKLAEGVDQVTMEKLFEAFQDVDDYLSSLKRILCSFLYSTGVRRAELVGLKQKDLDLSGSQLKVLGKRGKERIIPMTNFLKKEILRYLAIKNEKFPLYTGDEFFLHPKGTSLTVSHVYQFVRESLSMVTTSTKKGPHQFRHAFATHLLDEGAELAAVKELLGHSSLAATQVYTHQSIERLRDMYKKKHPKA